MDPRDWYAWAGCVLLIAIPVYLWGRGDGRRQGREEERRAEAARRRGMVDMGRVAIGEAERFEREVVNGY